MKRAKHPGDPYPIVQMNLDFDLPMQPDPDHPGWVLSSPTHVALNAATDHVRNYPPRDRLLAIACLPGHCKYPRIVASVFRTPEGLLYFAELVVDADKYETLGGVPSREDPRSKYRVRSGICWTEPTSIMCRCAGSARPRRTTISRSWTR